MAVRAALGAGRGRLLRQLLTESTLLALSAAVLGLLLAVADPRAAGAASPRASRPRAAEMQIDGERPALHAGDLGADRARVGRAARPARAQAAGARRPGRGHATTAGRAGSACAPRLVVWQLALSFMLLIGAALMLRSFAKLQQVDAGFRAENVLTMSVDLNWSTYATPERTASTRSASSRCTSRSRSGCAPCPAWSTAAPPGRSRSTPPSATTAPSRSRARDRNTAAPPRAQFVGASPDYFEALGVPVLRGRAFDAARPGRRQAGVVVVSRGLARRHFGQRRTPWAGASTGDGGRTWRTIVGVVGDVRQTGLEQEPPDMVYVPFLRVPRLHLHPVRAHAGRSRRRSPSRCAPQRPRSSTRRRPSPACARWSRSATSRCRSPRLTTLLLGLFAVLALAHQRGRHSAGVIAYSVSQRTQEIGIRMALGAGRRRVLAMVLGQGLRPIAIGLGLGLLGALALGRVMADLLFGIQPTDPLCFIGSAAVLLTVSVFACLLPARRATRIEPMLALRAEGM